MFELTKDPQADVDCQFDWTAWLAGDTIAQSTWSVPASSGLVTHSGAVDGANLKATIWLKGGTVAPAAYRVTNHITTAAGRVDERSIMVKVEQR